MKASVDKCQILSTSKDLSVKISEVQIKKDSLKNYQELTLKIIKNLKIIKIAYVEKQVPKIKQIMNEFFKLQFCCDPLTWMMYSRKPNKKINQCLTNINQCLTNISQF